MKASSITHPLLPQLRQALQALQALQPLADPERAAPMRAYMKNQFAFLGVAAPVRRAAVAGLVRPRLAHAELLAVGKYIFLRGNPFSGLPACASCHGENGHGTPQLPRLAGQHPRYTEDQLQQFNARARTNDNAVMHTVASKLTELEAHAVAAYIASLD